MKIKTARRGGGLLTASAMGWLQSHARFTHSSGKKQHAQFPTNTKTKKVVLSPEFSSLTIKLSPDILLQFLQADLNTFSKRIRWEFNKIQSIFPLSAPDWLARENIRFSSLSAAGDVSRVCNLCRWVADVPPRETCPSAKSEEKRMFSQATDWFLFCFCFLTQTHSVFQFSPSIRGWRKYFWRKIRKITALEELDI